jgi:RTA1 like protein
LFYSYIKAWISCSDTLRRYIICLTIAPTFFSAAIYLCLARIVVVYGEAHSRFRPRTYTLTFIACDFFSLVLQAVGGALADTAGTRQEEETGVHIMIAGLSFQVASLLLFAILCAEFAWRVKYVKVLEMNNFRELIESRKFRAFLFGKLIYSPIITLNPLSNPLKEIQEISTRLLG